MLRIAAALLALVLLPCAAARAADHCVAGSAGPASCPPGGVPAASLTAALATAQASGGEDVIHLGPGEHTTAGGFVYNQNGDDLNDLRIVGSGREQTILTTDTPTKDGSFVVLTLTGDGAADTNVSDLTIVGPDRPVLPSEAGDQPAGVALLQAEATDITIRNRADATRGGLHTGARLSSDSRILSSTISPGTVSGASGVEVTSPSAVVEDVQVVDSYWGVYVHPEGSARVSRTRIASRGAAVACFGCEGADVVNSVLLPADGATGLLSHAPGEPANVRASHVTIAGAAGPGTTVGAHAEVSVRGADATLEIDNSIVTGVDVGISWQTAPEATGTTIARWHYSTVQGGAQGTPGGTTESSNIQTGAPQFVDAPAGGFHLEPDAAQVDAGRAEGEYVATTLDLDREPRPVDGDGDGLAQPDQGADEYQARPPVAVLTSPDTVQVGTPAQLSAAASTSGDPGDSVVSYVWDFGDGSVGNGADVTHVYGAPGTYTITVTVTDSTGKSSSASRQISVVAPSQPPPPPPPPPPAPPIAPPAVPPASIQRPTADRNPPTLVAALRALRFRRGRGTTLRVGLSEAARVRIQFTRKGRAVKRKTRSLRAGTTTLQLRPLTRRLRAGTYTIVLTATDRAGNVSRRFSLKATLRP